MDIAAVCSTECAAPSVTDSTQHVQKSIGTGMRKLRAWPSARTTQLHAAAWHEPTGQ